MPWARSARHNQRYAGRDYRREQKALTGVLCHGFTSGLNVIRQGLASRDLRRALADRYDVGHCGV